MAHKHAEKMKQYAEDAAKHDRPWTQWECRDSGEELWSEMVDHPWWQLYTEYRRKPETVKIIVNGREWVLPKWITEPPDEGKFIAGKVLLRYLIRKEKVDILFLSGAATSMRIL